MENSLLRAILHANGAVAVLGDITEDKEDNCALVLLVSDDTAVEEDAEPSWEIEIVLGALAATAFAGSLLYCMLRR